MDHPSSVSTTAPEADHTDYNPLAVDAYASHLAAFSGERAVTASDDIYNSEGALLIQKGTPISAQITRRIVNFKLSKPIEASVNISNEIDSHQLQRDFSELLRSDATLQQLVYRQDLTLLLQNQCNYYQQFSFVRQKITVLAERMPKVYQRSLEASLVCLLIAKQMRLPAAEIEVVFLAALVHDIGMLHINPELVDQKGALAPEDWRQIQAHALIGQKILQATPGIPAPVCRAVAEHHERCDGTGYPARKQGEELSQLGQLIALADSAIAIYHHRLQPRGDSWRDLIPMLQMNGQAYFYRNYAALITLLKASNFEAQRQQKPGQLNELTQQLLERIVLFRECLQFLEPTLRDLKTDSSCRETRALRQVHAHVTLAVYGSGILDGNYSGWLKQITAQQQMDAKGELLEARLMLEELAFHLQRLYRMAALFSASSTTALTLPNSQFEEWSTTLNILIGGDSFEGHTNQQFAV